MFHQVILDTNVFVAALFNPRSYSSQLIRQVRDGRLQMVWDPLTRTETEYVIRKIPPLHWEAVADLFDGSCCYHGSTDPGAFSYVLDPADRKFAALAQATGAILITMDQDLLGSRDPGTQGLSPFELSPIILSPFECVEWLDDRVSDASDAVSGV